MNFYQKHKRFFGVLNSTKYNGKKVYTITKNCIYVNSNVFSDCKLKLINYDNVIYENIAKDFLYILTSGYWSTYYEFYAVYLGDLNQYYNLNHEFNDIQQQLCRTALAALPQLFKVMKKYRTQKHFQKSNYFLQELYLDKFL